MRVPVKQFKPTASMRRVLRSNADVRVERAPAGYDEAKFDLYRRYLNAQHDESMSRDADSFREFLCESPTHSFEFQYYLGDRLVGVSVMDQVPSGLSSVYMYFDPEESQRSLGTLSILREIQFCLERGLPYYYLGYLVSGCRKMEYKARFLPFELLVSDGRWLGFRARSNA
jgi:arginine-tRNA-protein transferase